MGERARGSEAIALKDAPGRERPPTPLFICGNARGGTTLLVRLFDGHPELFVLPTETQLYPTLATRPIARWLLRAAELVPCRRAVELLAVPALARLGFQGRAALLERLRAWAREYPMFRSLPAGAIEAAPAKVDGPHRYWDPFLSLFCQMTGTALAGKRYWVEKTPGAERFAALSDRWTDRAARFLHVIRDPRDFTASTLVRSQRLGMEGSRAQAIVRLCFIWSQSVGWCDHGIRTIEGRYHAVRYEDLVADPQAMMRAICALVGIPMHSELLRATRLGEPVRLNSSDLTAAGLPGQVVSSRVGSFREHLTRAEIELIEELVPAQMEACGYEPGAEASSPAASAAPDLERGAVKRDFRSRFLTFTIARAQASWRGRSMPFIVGATG